VSTRQGHGGEKLLLRSDCEPPGLCMAANAVECGGVIPNCCDLFILWQNNY